MAKLLLVEDDNNLREIYQARLAAEGYEIVSAQDGEEALVVAKQQKPDLVISDVMMPKISGFEMLDILRNTPGLENVRVIMLTALSQGEDRERADSLGADKYLVKSQVTLEDIVKTARALLEGDESSDEAAAATLAAAGASQSTDAAPTPAAEPPTILAAADPVATPPAEEPVAPAPAPAEPVTPVPDPTPVATPPADATVSATPTSTDDEADEQTANALVDDKLVVDAVNELTKGDATKTDEELTATEDEPQVEAKTATGGNRVIQPLQGEQKSSLDELVAQEEANEAEAAANAAVATPEPVVAPPAPEQAEEPEQPEQPAQAPEEAPQTPPAPAKEYKDGIDPNSIAL